MKKIILFLLVLLLGVSMLGCMQMGDPVEKEKLAVLTVVETFGGRLKNVALLAPKDILKQSMQDNYGDLVTPQLIEKWLKNPQKAPGRLTSSPWPDRIEIQDMEKLEDGSYKVKGEIIEITSAEAEDDGVFIKRPITLIVGKQDGKWLINKVTLGAYEEPESIVYKNNQYGFDFTLPNTWKNYKIIEGKWEGTGIGTNDIVETGPMISIRHPLWTEEKPRQDIPIMIFTLKQWDKLQSDQFHIGAAPIGPRELGRNSKYVFALPARYNFAFLPGYEEVEEILNRNSLKPTENFR